MAQLAPKLDADGVNALLRRAFPGAEQARTMDVISVSPGRLHMVAPYRDSAAYALVLAHIGDQLMAVTSQLNMSFLRGAQPGDMHAEAEMLRLGRRLAVMDVRIWTESPNRLAAQANVTYAIPA